MHTKGTKHFPKDSKFSYLQISTVCLLQNIGMTFVSLPLKLDSPFNPSLPIEIDSILGILKLLFKTKMTKVFQKFY